MTMVKCSVAEMSIRALACVDQQDDKRCFCPQAAAALNYVSEENEPEEGDPIGIGARKKQMREKLVTLKARASGFFRQPPEKRFCGPALVVRNGGKAVDQNAAGAGLGVETSNDSVRRPNKRLNPATVERTTSAMSPLSGVGIARAAQGVAEAQVERQLRPQIDDREDLHGSQGTSGDAREPAASGVRRPPALEPGHVERQIAGERPGQQVPNGPIDDRRAAPDVVSNAPLSLDAAEEAAIRAAHQRLGGNIRKMMSELGCSRSTLQRKLDSYDLRPTAAAARAELPGKKCSVDGCPRMLGAGNLSGKCQPCQRGILPGGGYVQCATDGCPRRVQVGRQNGDKCAICRSGSGAKAGYYPKTREGYAAMARDLDVSQLGGDGLVDLQRRCSAEIRRCLEAAEKIVATLKRADLSAPTVAP